MTQHALNWTKSNTFKKLVQLSRANWEKILGILIGISLLGSYGFTDDYSNVVYSRSFFGIIKMGFSQGRPILGLGAFFEYRYITTLRDYFILHIFSLLAIVALLSIIKNIFSCIYTDVKYLPVLAVSATISCAAIIVLTGWEIELIPLLIMDLALLGLLRVYRNQDHRILAYILISLPIITYQPVLAFVWTVLGLSTLLSRMDGNEVYISKRLCTKNFIFVTMCFVFIEICSLVVSSKFHLSTGPRTQIVSNIPQKLNFIFKVAIPQALHGLGPWVATSKEFVVIAILNLIGFLALVKFNIRRILFFAALFVVAFSPSLITAENWQSNRSLLAPEWISNFLIFYGLMHIINYLSNLKYAQIVTLTIVIFSLCNGIWLSVVEWRNPQVHEIKLIESQVSTEQCKEVNGLIPSTWQESLAPYTSMDEFGLPSSYPAWSVGEFARLICKSKGVEIGVQSISLDVSNLKDGENVTLNFAKLLQK